jgi:hypothetical protein
MYDLIIPKGVYHRANGNLPPFELINMLAEETPSAKGGVSLLSFPGFSVFATRGSGPINGIYRRADLFGGAVFVISGSSMYVDGSPVATPTVDGTGPISWASSDIEIVVARGGHAYSNIGPNMVAITFPDGASVTAVTFMAGLFIFARAGSQKFYWSAVLDARTIDALDFASAESMADHLLDVLAIADILYLAGKDSIEAWYPTGDGTLPFLRISQRTTAVGVKATGCMAMLDNALHFIGSDNIVYRMADVPQRISNNGIEEDIAASASWKLFSYHYQGHSILSLRLDTKSYGYDAATSQWHERKSDTLTNWIASSACNQDNGTPLFGSSADGKLFTYSGWADDTRVLSREFTAAISLTSTQILDSVELDCNTGQSAVLSGSGSAPLLEMRRSRDAGNTWSDWMDANLGNSSLGGTGEYRVRAKWRRLGMFDAPGALLHFRVTDPVPFRVSGAIASESSAGRER